MKRLALALLSLLLAAPVPAEELARFACQRPEPLEEGSATNAALACTLVHGIVLKPGEVFSFNQAMTPGLGRFVEGTAYASGKVIRSEGGGICQVSAALYNAALLAGLEVLERHSHSIYDPASAYVPAGRDSAISRAVGADMRFRNSTAAPLALSVTATAGRVEVVLEGHQRRPRPRWIETQELKREAHPVQRKPDPSLAAGMRVQQQKGFDGLRVRRRLCKGPPQDASDCVPLGVDEYMTVPELWKEGPAMPESGSPTAAPIQEQQP